MEKHCTVLWRSADADPRELSTWSDQALLPGLATGAQVRAATVHIESPDPDHAGLRYGHGADGLLLAGLVSVWLDSYQDLGAVGQLLEHAPVATQAGYLVCESVPTPYGDVLTWGENRPSPGLSMVTLLDKPADTDEAEFYRYWHELHRLTTAECHPFASYVRNEIVRPLTAGAPRYRGVVTESCPEVQDLVDPHRFYVSGGDIERLRTNRRRVANETAHFIDFATIQVAPMTEHIVRRLAPTSP